MARHIVTLNSHTDSLIGNCMLDALTLSAGDKYTFDDFEMTLTWCKNGKVMRIRSFETVRDFLDYLLCI